MRQLWLWLREAYRSISSLPTLIFVVIVAMAILQAGTADADDLQLPAWLDQLNLKSPDTVRPLLAAVIGGMFTLTIFAYTMVMNVIDRAISNYSPRLLPLLLGQRYHQVVLGFSAGTIGHALIILLAIRTPEGAAAEVPVLAALSSGLLSIGALLLFIYFINGVSNSIHINTLLRFSYRDTIVELQSFAAMTESVCIPEMTLPDLENGLRASGTGYLTEVDFHAVARNAADYGGKLFLTAELGSFVQKGDLLLGTKNNLSIAQTEQLEKCVRISPEVPLNVYTTGFKHLVEIAVKGCSPAINDPGTTLTALKYLTDLFRELSAMEIPNTIRSQDGKGEVVFLMPSYEELAGRCFPELEYYLEKDPWAAAELRSARVKVAGYAGLAS